METKGTTGEETTSYWFDLPIDVAEFEEKLGVGAESGDYRIIEKVLPFADEVHEHTSVYQLNELDFMYRQLSSDMQEEYVSLLTVYENLEALYICRNVITVYPDCKSMIDVARQKLMNDPTFKHLSEDCQEYYFDFEAYASHLQEHGKFLVTAFKLHKKKNFHYFSSKLFYKLDNSFCVPPVAIRSSTIITFCPGVIASLCISIVAVPYSSS